MAYIVTYLKDYPEFPNLKRLTSYINYSYVKEFLVKPTYYLKKVIDIFKKDKLYLNGIDTNTKPISNKQYPILLKKDNNSDNLGGGSVNSKSEENNNNNTNESNSDNQSVNSNSENNNNSNSENSSSNNESSDHDSTDSGYGDNQEEFDEIGLGSPLPLDEKEAHEEMLKNRDRIGEYQAEAHYSKKGKRSLERDPSD
jgi:hypothetical protein